MDQRILTLRMQRQHLINTADEKEYVALYRDLQPGQNVYWNGFGQPPVLSFRAAFDDLHFNRRRQLNRELIKGRFGGGNLGWIIPDDLELFAALYRKPLIYASEVQASILNLLQQLGPLTIHQIKEETGWLVKEITPALHRLQEAFLIYEDQFDGEWDRGFCRFEEMFPDADLNRYSRMEALQIVLQRFAYRMVWFDIRMAKDFYKLPAKEIKSAICALMEQGILCSADDGYMLCKDARQLPQAQCLHFVRAIHRNDVLYKANETNLKQWIQPLIQGLPYDHEPLQYLLIDGAFHGAVVGHFRNGPYDLNDVVCDLADAQERQEEILAAVQKANDGKLPARFVGRPMDE